MMNSPACTMNACEDDRMTMSEKGGQAARERRNNRRRTR
jgi:hypothetical protein